ncbi:MAG TPA: hypothetical protein VJU81_10110 [Methylomirabilota bacterium]|nr:hypothetical protein [Methylomirabilota bacterium]
MRRVMLVVATFLTTLVCLTPGGAPAQTRPTDDMEILREKLRADKKLVLAATLQLTDAEGKAFWPVYNAYQSDMVQHYDRVLALIEGFSKHYQSLSDEAARKLISDFLNLQSNHPAVLKKYAPQFLQVLPAKKVAQLYQVENKLRALIDYDLAQSIPLIK